jgi:transposase
MSTPNNICEGPLAFAAYVGLDWGDEQHAVSLCTAGADRIERTTLNHTPEALAAWANGLRTRFGDGKIAVCLEQARGPLLYALLQYEHLVLYPINPKSLARFREALHPSHAKDDPVDADLALDMVHKHRDRLRPWQADTVETRQLGLLVEARRGFVDLNTQLSLQLQAHLKAIFPQALELVGQDLSSRMATDFLEKWATLQEVQKAKPATLRKFYYGHNSRREEMIQRRLELIQNAVALTNDPALLPAYALAIRTLARQLAALRPQIGQYDQQIAAVFSAHPDAALFDSLPGAGSVMAPRLLVSLGTDRGRYPSSVGVSCYSGIAPVTEKSGRTEYWVHMRWSCPKFLRQTWHEFAASSIQFSEWARCCYQELKGRMGHHEAVRKLAYKWQRIVWRMWQERQPYDEARYIRRLQQRGLKAYAGLVVESAEHG